METPKIIAEIRFSEPIKILPGETLSVVIPDAERDPEDANRLLIRPSVFSRRVDRVLLRLPCGGELFTVEYQEAFTRMDFEDAVLKQTGGYFFCPLDCNKTDGCPRFKKFVEDLELHEPAVVADLWVEPADGDDSDRNVPYVADVYPEVPSCPRPGHFAWCAFPSSHFHARSLFQKVLDRIVNGKRKAAKRCARDKKIDEGLCVHAGDSSTGGDMLSPRHEVDPATNGEPHHKAE